MQTQLFRVDDPKEYQKAGPTDLVRLLPVYAGLHQLPEDAMHRIAIGDPQCFSHQRFAKLGIRMVDGESLGREFYPRRRAPSSPTP